MTILELLKTEDVRIVNARGNIEMVIWSDGLIKVYRRELQSISATVHYQGYDESTAILAFLEINA